MTSSAPGVTPAEQEHYAAAAQLERSGASATQVAAGLRHFDLLAQLARDRAPFEEARRRASSADTAGELDSPFVPDDEDVWNFICAGLDYDPRAALERITVPLLALFGSDDPILPVAESVEVYRAAVPTDLLRIEVFPGADHRLEVGEPPRLADGYLETVSSFVSSAVDRT